MPFFRTDRPSLALGLLKAALTREGIGCDVKYLNISYERIIGNMAYEVIEGSSSTLLLGEWIFAESLWGPDARRDATYLTMLLEGFLAGEARVRDGISVDELADVMRAARAAAGPFIQSCLGSMDWARYRIVGFTSTFQQQISSLALARHLKERYPGLVCVVGGANCEGEMGGAVFELFPFLDAVCTGEGDLVFPKFARAVIDGDLGGELPGMWWRRPAPSMSQVQADPSGQDLDGPLVRDLDSLPVPDFDDFFRASGPSPDGHTRPIALPIETSRGCWWGAKHHCTFCGLNGSEMAFRYKSAARAYGEIRLLWEKYGTLASWLEAADNIIPMSYFRSLLPMLADSPPGPDIYYETKANLRPDHIRILSRAGVTCIQPGIESLSTPVLRRMRKGVSGLQNVQLLKLATQYGVRVYWNYLVGFPHETDADYAGQSDLFRLLSHLPPPFSGGVSKVRFDRFSPHTTSPGEFGITGLRPYPAYHLIYAGLDQKQVSRLAYFFTGEVAGETGLSARIAALNASVKSWFDAHSASLLVFLDDGDRLLFFDTRPTSRHTSTILEEPWRSLYLACEVIRSISSLLYQICSHPAWRGQTVSDFDRTLERLKDRGLILIENGQVLSLALPVDRGYKPPGKAAARLEKWLLAAKMCFEDISDIHGLSISPSISSR